MTGLGKASNKNTTRKFRRGKGLGKGGHSDALKTQVAKRPGVGRSEGAPRVNS